MSVFSRTSAFSRLCVLPGLSVFSGRARLRRGLCATAVGGALLCGAVPSCGLLPGSGERNGPGSGSADDKGVNILLTGIDQRRGMSDAEKDRLHVNGKECNCTDTMMLLHLSGDRKRVSGVSIPRDSYVPFARHKGAPERGKINAAFKHGGPELAKRTVELNTGVHVDHYAQVDFSRFVRAVDDMGGAEVCTDQPLWDFNSGLDLKAGHHDLDGKQALRYVRARHVSPPGDLGRNRRQQYVLASMLTALTGDRAQSDPAAMARTANALRKSVRTDGTLTAARMAELGSELQGLTSRRTEFATVPMADFDLRVPGWGSSLKWDRKRAAELFRDLREDRALTANPHHRPPPGVRAVSLPPSAVPVQVAGTGARAERLEDGLRKNGFRIVEGPVPAAAQSPGGRTRITYNPANEPQAQVVATALPGAKLSLVPGHSVNATVWPGERGAEAKKVVEDRNSVEGAALTGDRVGGCKEQTSSS